MPFEEQTIVDVRMKMIEAVNSGVAVAQVARDFGVSRPTVYEWCSRWDANEDLLSLADRSHARHTQAEKTLRRVEKLLIAERKRWGFGAKKILQRLREKHPDIRWPHRSTVDGILDRAGLVEERRGPRKAEKVTPFQRPYPAQEPGELWTADFKGQFRLGNGRYCYPLTVADQVSRFVIVVHGLPDVRLEPTWRLIERALREYGLPKAFHTDNGSPFGHGNSRLSTMAVRLMKLGIEPVFSRPGKPQDNGTHERMHRTLKKFAVIPPADSFIAQQKKFDQFRRMFNHERPHEALDMRRPAKLFTGSNRRFPRRTPVIEYEPSLEVRRVSQQGAIKWGGNPIFISQALAGECIAIKSIDYDIHEIYFSRFLIGRLIQDKFH
jgi:transposase InsO family protein